MLGPGIFTRNPNASFWVVVPATAAIGRVSAALMVGASAGAAHGLARFAGILVRRRTRPEVDWSLIAVLWNLRFHRVDGVLLVVVGTASLIALVSGSGG
jgi:hypothetical protein